MYLPLAVNGKQTSGQWPTVRIRMLLLRIMNLMDCLNLFSKYLLKNTKSYKRITPKIGCGKHGGNPSKVIAIGTPESK